MVKVTDEDIIRLEQALDIKLLDYQKDMIKRFIEADNIVVIPRHHSYSSTLKTLLFMSAVILSNKKGEETHGNQECKNH